MFAKLNTPKISIYIRITPWF